jgi:Rieske 2Fe-2S family protein
LNPSVTHNAAFDALISRQRPGWSLEQPFYISPEIFEIERRGWLANQWFLLGHCSEVSVPGTFIVRELLGESLIIVRDDKGEVRGFYNVCRHRGSRICDRDGKSNALVCPYHAWSYRLDGSLRSAAALPADVDPASLSLHAVPVREVGGLILASLSGRSADADTIAHELEPSLRFHGIPEARIAARRSYSTRANWKLVFENFVECYHCLPAHPEYCRVMRHVDALARDAPEASEAWQKTTDTWLQEQANAGSPVPINPVSLKSSICGASRAPIGAGRQTQSQDGLPVAPLMGQLARFDGGVSTFRCEPFIFLAAPNDHAVMFRFSPTAAAETGIEVTWLVSSGARETEVDLDRMIWLWDVTTLQDKELIERNAAGIRSRSYTPGPYSKLEGMPARFVSRYLSELREP